MSIQELKCSAEEKLNQGDVRIYKLATKPKLKLKAVKDPVLVYGDSGNHHKLVGGAFTIGKYENVLLVIVKRKTKIVHEQHGPHELAAGVYLVDRAREKGMMDDLVAPVSD